MVLSLVAQPIRYDEFPLIGWDLVSYPGGTALLQREHHIVHDGWSVGVFLSQLQDAYHCFERGTGWRPPGDAITYFDWARQQRDWWPAQTAKPPGRTGPGSWPTSRRRLRSRLPSRNCPMSPPTPGTQPLGAAAIRGAGPEPAARLGVTSFAFLLACYRRSAGFRERQGGGWSVIGSSFANRERPTRRTSSGCWLNVLRWCGPRPGRVPGDGARAEMALIGAAEAHQRCRRRDPPAAPKRPGQQPAVPA